jgi:hypothetical protein
MKITLLLCMIALLTSCSKDQSSPQPTPEAYVFGGGSMDSPIIVSDSSTHAQHKVFHTNAGGFYVYDSGYTVVKLTCVKDISCPGSSPGAKPYYSLTYPWTLDVLDSVSAKIVTLSSDNTQTIIPLNYYNNPVDITPVSASTDLGVANLTFNKATLTIGGQTYNLQCGDGAPGTKDCVLWIDYCKGGNCS